MYWYCLILALMKQNVAFKSCLVNKKTITVYEKPDANSHHLFMMYMAKITVQYAKLIKKALLYIDTLHTLYFTHYKLHKKKK